MDLPFEWYIPAILQEMLSASFALQIPVSLHARVLPPWLRPLWDRLLQIPPDNVQKEFFLYYLFRILPA